MRTLLAITSLSLTLLFLDGCTEGSTTTEPQLTILHNPPFFRTLVLEPLDHSQQGTRGKCTIWKYRSWDQDCFIEQAGTVVDDWGPPEPSIFTQPSACQGRTDKNIARMWYIFDVPPIDGEIISAELQYEITGFTNFQGIELDRSLYTYVESGDSTIFPLPATEESWDYIDDNQAYHDSVLYNGPGIIHLSLDPSLIIPDGTVGVRVCFSGDVENLSHVAAAYTTEKWTYKLVLQYVPLVGGSE